MKLPFVDASTAHLKEVCHEDYSSELPGEAEAERCKCGELLRWLSGTGPVAQGWGKVCCQRSEDVGYKLGRSSSVVVLNPDTEARIVVLLDDFTLLGYDDELDKVDEQMRICYDVKVGGATAD